MDQNSRRRMFSAYEAAATIVWAALLIVAAVVLEGTASFNLLIGVLVAGAAFFLVILPVALSRIR